MSYNGSPENLANPSYRPFTWSRGARTWVDLPAHVGAFVEHDPRERGAWSRSAKVPRTMLSQARSPVEQPLRLLIPGFAGHTTRRATPFAIAAPGFFEYSEHERGLRDQARRLYAHNLRVFEAYNAPAWTWPPSRGSQPRHPAATRISAGVAAACDHLDGSRARARRRRASHAARQAGLRHPALARHLWAARPRGSGPDAGRHRLEPRADSHQRRQDWALDDLSIGHRRRERARGLSEGAAGRAGPADLRPRDGAVHAAGLPRHFESSLPLSSARGRPALACRVAHLPARLRPAAG